MGVQTGSFTVQTGTGNQVVTKSGVNNATFIFIGTAASFSAFTYEIDKTNFIGFDKAPSGNKGCVVNISEDNVNPSQAWRRFHTDASIVLVDVNGDVILSGEVTATTSSNFTINWAVNTTGGGDEIAYMALEGFTTEVLQWDLTTATGDQGVTGIGFQPDAIMNIHAGNFQAAINTKVANAEMGIGFSDDGGRESGIGAVTHDGDTTTNDQKANSSSSFIIQPSGSGIEYEANLKTFDTDGFTVTKISVPPGAERMLSLCLKDGNFEVGNENTNADPNTVTMVQSFTPNGIFVIGTGQTSNVGRENDYDISMGFGDGTNNFVHHTFAEDNLVLNGVKTNTQRVFSNSDSLLINNNNDTTVDEDGVLDTFASGSFREDWATAPGTSNRGWFAMEFIVKQSNAGAITFVGNISKGTFKSLAGALTMAGALATATLFSKALTGVLTFSGSLIRIPGKSLSGALTFIGTLTTQKFITKALAGTITFTGTFAGFIFKKTIKLKNIIITTIVDFFD